MFDIGSPKDFTLTKQSIFRRNAFGAKLVAKLDIAPAYSPIWDYKSLAIFLNEMIEYEPTRVKPFSDKYFEFKFTHSILGNDYQIVIHIFYEKNFKKNVSISRYVILSKGWKTIKKRKDVLYSFQISFPVLSLDSDTIFHLKSFAFINKYEFNKIIPKNLFTSFFIEFSEIFIKQPNFNSIINFEQLEYLNQGYLNIPKLAKIENNSYELCRNYISPFAKSFLNLDDCLDGIQLDCTFKVI